MRHGKSLVLFATVLAQAFFGCSQSKEVTSGDDYFDPEKAVAQAQVDSAALRAPSVLYFRPRAVEQGQDEMLRKMVQEQNERVARLEREVAGLSTQQQVEEAVKDMEEKRPNSEATLLAIIREQNLRLEELIEQVRLLSERKAEVVEEKPVKAPVPVRRAVVPVRDSEARSLYARGVGSYNRRQYVEASRLFESALTQGIRRSMADNCRFWIGVCRFQSKEYASALKLLNEVANDRSSDKRSSALLMAGQTFDQMGRSDLARVSYRKIVEEHPNSNLRAIAERKLVRWSPVAGRS